MVKEKQTRTYDQDGFRKRAACLCVRDSQEHEILLVTSSRATDHWIVPGGGVEPNEDPSGAAIRETEEEAGVRGVIKRCLGDFEVRDVQNLERKHRTSVFVLEVNEELDEWEDSKSRLRRWFPLEEALRLLAIHKPVQCTYITFLIRSSPSLCQKFSHLITLDSPHFSVNHSLPIFPPNSDPSSMPSLPHISPPSDSSTASRYLQVNHFPSDSNKKNNSSNNNNSTTVSNASFHAFICTRDVYSTDSEIGSETAEDGPALIDTSNHYNAGVGAIEAPRESDSANKKSDLLSMAANSSSVNS